MATETRMTTDAAKAEITRMVADFRGTIGVAAHKLGAGDEIMLNADAIFPTASTFKVVLLYTLYRLADAGRIDLAQRVTLEDRHRVPGSGVLQDLDSGAALTIKDIATLMIVLSDNAATDIIYDLIGREAIDESIRLTGMEQTHLPLNCWDILAGIRDLDPNDPSLTYAELKRRLGAEEGSWECAGLRETPENDITTPRDMLALMEAIERGDGLTKASRDAVLDILLRQKYGERIPAMLPFGTRVAHKTGSVKGVRNDVGLVYRGDTTYSVALFSKRAEDEYAATLLLAKISRVIYDAFV